MEELEKWKAVNACETFQQLELLIPDLGEVEYSGGRVKSTQEVMDALAMAKETKFYRLMTRNYGLRAKLMYLDHYETK